MKKQLITLVALVAIPAISFAQTADEVIDKHVAAIGGADKIAAVKTLEMDQSMAVMGMEMTAKNVYVIGQSLRSDVSVMGQQIINVFDGDKGWMINPMAGGSSAQDLPAEALKAAKTATEPQMFHLAYLKADKLPYELVGKEKFKNEDAFNLKVTRPEGVYNYYVAADDYQLLGLKGTGPQGETSATFSDIKVVDGLSVPHTFEVSNPQVPAPITAKITKLTINGPVDNTIFAKPK